MDPGVAILLIVALPLVIVGGLASVINAINADATAKHLARIHGVRHD